MTINYKDKILSTNVRAVKLIYSWQKWLIPSIILSALFNSLAPFITIYMSAEIVNELAGSRDVRRLLTFILITISADLAAVIIGGLFNKLKSHQWQSFEDKEKRMFIEFGFNMDYEHLENPEIHKYRCKIDESNRINAFGIWRMIISFQNTVNNIINIGLSVGFMSGLFVLIIKQAGEVIGGIMFSFLLATLVTANVWFSIYKAKKLTKVSEEISSNMVDENLEWSGLRKAYGMGTDTRLYNMGIIYENFINKSINAQKSNNKKYKTKERDLQIVDSILWQGINFTTYVFICLNAVRGLFQIGSVIKYIGFITKMFTSIVSLSSDIAMFKMNQPFLTHYLNFFEIENKMCQGVRFIEKDNENNKYEFEFHGVSFKYPGSERYVLKNISMKLNTGQRLAVVGMNGSGKTTMIKLLCRIYDPTEGMITLNGIDVKTFDYDQYMSIFSVVFQDFKLFSFTLGQNVAASVNVDTQHAEKCLFMAGFGGRLSGMAKGLETPIYKDFDEDGVEISGGEAQKIALARALYKNTPFIILDEPTAALDPIAEFEIYSKFNEIVGSKTAVYISHRLSSCRFCDNIVVFHEGELIQRGSHDTLIANKNGKYHELWNAQAQYYTESEVIVSEDV